MLRFDHCTPEARTLVVCISPYNMATRVADPPDFEPYQELFRPGVFRDQVEQAQSTPLRIWLTVSIAKESTTSSATRLACSTFPVVSMGRSACTMASRATRRLRWCGTAP